MIRLRPGCTGDQGPRGIVRGALVCVGAALAIVGLALADPTFVLPHVQIELAAHLWEPLLVLAPLTLLVIAGGIDLSVGSIMALAAVTCGLLHAAGAPPLFWISGALLCGLIAGALNGILVAQLRVHPLLLTLATLAAYRGLAEGFSGGRALSGFPSWFAAVGEATRAGLPLAGWLAIGAAAIAALLLTSTRLGRHIRASGANETAARFVGIEVTHLRTALYATTGLAAGAAALLFTARRNTAKADLGLGLELELITALVLGGVRIGGGAGGVGGGVFGLLLIHELREFISWRSWGHEWAEIALGGLLLGAVAVGALRRARGSA